jgi:hypothetical protein
MARFERVEIGISSVYCHHKLMTFAVVVAVIRVLAGSAVAVSIFLAVRRIVGYGWAYRTDFAAVQA